MGLLQAAGGMAADEPPAAPLQVHTLQRDGSLVVRAGSVAPVQTAARLDVLRRRVGEMGWRIAVDDTMLEIVVPAAPTNAVRRRGHLASVMSVMG